jgi:Ni/Co efflux regulator RcnB
LNTVATSITLYQLARQKETRYKRYLVRERQRDRETKRQRDRETERQRDKQAGKKVRRQAGRYGGRDGDRKTEMYRNTGIER